MNKHLLSLILTLSSVTTLAQETAMPKVAKTVQEFVNINGTNMSLLTPSCANFDACTHMNYHVKRYAFKGTAQAAFEKLISLKPNEIWDGSSRFEMEYDPESQTFIGKEHELPQIKQGQVFSLELDIVKQMKIPVAFEVVELDPEHLTLSFSYLKQNKSKGIQRISFKPNGENFDIVHETHYESNSKFRDRHLYGHFHTKLLDDVWERFAKRL